MSQNLIMSAIESAELVAVNGKFSSFEKKDGKVVIVDILGNSVKEYSQADLDGALRLASDKETITNGWLMPNNDRVFFYSEAKPWRKKKLEDVAG